VTDVSNQKASSHSQMPRCTLLIFAAFRFAEANSNHIPNLILWQLWMPSVTFFRSHSSPALELLL
jgi:hypothetical protein